jgi:hypothetical protein
VDIRLPRLRFLDLDSVDIAPRDQTSATEAPCGVITIDAPELTEFEIEAGGTTDFKSFTLRAPKLRLLGWCNQYAERMVIDVGRPGSVRFGGIKLMSIYSRGMEYYREQMMRMLQGLLPNIPPENLDDVAKSGTGHIHSIDFDSPFVFLPCQWHLNYYVGWIPYLCWLSD